MTVGLEHLRNDEIGIQAGADGAETIRLAEPVIEHGWRTFSLRAQRVPLRMWALFLLATVIAVASETLTDERSAEHPASARPLPLLLMMTEKPARHMSP